MASNDSLIACLKACPVQGGLCFFVSYELQAMSCKRQVLKLNSYIMAFAVRKSFFFW